MMLGSVYGAGTPVVEACITLWGWGPHGLHAEGLLWGQAPQRAVLGPPFCGCLQQPRCMATAMGDPKEGQGLHLPGAPRVGGGLWVPPHSGVWPCTP